MKKIRVLSLRIFVFCLMVSFTAAPVTMGAEQYMPDFEKLQEAKRFFENDPRPVVKTYGPKQIMPAEDYAHYCHDMATMKAKWAEATGFKSSDLVGKIAPEIQPGKYTYQDKQKYPGLKELMIPLMYEKFFKPGEPPFGGCFAEFEVVPTQQIYYPLPYTEATLRNMGKTKQDAQGFFLPDTFISGIPFPKPSGSERMKAMQIIYNFMYRNPSGCDQNVGMSYNTCWSGKFRQTYMGIGRGPYLRLWGRVYEEPLGVYDERAKIQHELDHMDLTALAPRDAYGNCTYIVTKVGTDPVEIYLYSAMLRRIRKMTGTDTQDTGAGSNVTYDDGGGFHQQLSPTLYPYEFKILAEREYLVPAYSTDGIECIEPSKLEIQNVRLERRPHYVLELIQKDATYIYGKRILYVDKETFTITWFENYDQKGRLFRGGLFYPIFIPEMGLPSWLFGINWNFQTPQTSITMTWPLVPVRWVTRDYFSFQNMQARGK
ncbi:MAG: DUF1329 domain-containing protein [Desulfatitalea sp.]|nr:DUF1329 domain-containing protein [Desulfatitalea sp.]NNK02158.1 DUF1329 domain-containing protein [Desulfatitalea sp.]